MNVLQTQDLGSRMPLSRASAGKLSYTTHAIGKWHVGFANLSMTPLRRGCASTLSPSPLTRCPAAPLPAPDRV